MKIIVVGCGKIGANIAKFLIDEKHDVVLIDQSENIIQKLTEQLDCMGIVGNGATLSILDEAGLMDCDILIACTNSDEVNLLSCIIAKKNKNCKKIARVRNPEYNDQVYYIRNEIGLSMTINPEADTAREIFNILRYSSILSYDSFLRGRANLLKVQIEENSNICGYTLSDIKKKFDFNILICVIERENEVIIPKGKDSILIGDKISFLSDHENAINFFKCAGIDYSPIKNIMIVGASRITQYLLKYISNNSLNYIVKVIDIDKDVCEKVAESYPFAKIIRGDGSDKKLLLSEGIENVDGFISLTGIDEENIVLSLYADKISDAKILTKVDRLSFQNSLDELKIGSIINPQIISVNNMLRYVRGMNNSRSANVERLYKICNEKAEALEFDIKNESTVTNVLLKELPLKENVLIACIYRNGKVIFPGGNDVLLQNDKVVVITKEKNINSLEEILK